jgi:hypothetical protein
MSHSLESHSLESPSLESQSLESQSLESQSLEDDWGWFIHIDEELPTKNHVHTKRISVPCTIKEDDELEKKIASILNEKIKKNESDTYLYIGCVVTILTFMVSVL